MPGSPQLGFSRSQRRWLSGAYGIMLTMSNPQHSRTAQSRPAESSEPLPSPAAYGFVGTGEITAAIVEGLNVNVADPPTVFLSPRGRGVGQELSGRFRNIHVCDSNQEVLDSATSIVLAVRPPIVREVLAELTFQPGHVVMSAAAGVRLERLHDWTAPAGHVVRVVPLPQAAHGQSLTAMYPDDAAARDLFGRVGGVFVPGNEGAFDAVSAATATFAAHLDYLTTIANWLADHDVDHDAATTYMTHIFGQMGQSLLHSAHSLATLTSKHMTPGGNNEQFMTDLRRDGVPEVVRHGLDGILTRLRQEH